MTIKKLVARVDKLEVNAPDPEDSKVIIELLSKETIRELELLSCDNETKKPDLSKLSDNALDELSFAYKSTETKEVIIS